MESVLILTFIIIIIFFPLFSISSPTKKGSKGESWIARSLKQLDKDEYLVLNDLLFQTKYGSSQIDHIVISIYGIFVIETKNYKGWIYGSEASEYWSQIIYKEKNQFRNPIRQNLAHVYALKTILSDFRQIPYYPIVVFVGSAKFKNIYAHTPVIYGNELIQTITCSSITPCLSIEQIRQIRQDILFYINKNKVTKSEHVHQINQQARFRQWKEAPLVCPRCGGTLVERNGRFGKFYGCSNYPTCRYTRSK
ncbi:MAG: NERD domain-containing protein [Spirochaetia bacterium]|jgi:hypothetical protein|nr:NERD domain-containing protein [Spirochaetia bacterium]